MPVNKLDEMDVCKHYRPVNAELISSKGKCCFSIYYKVVNLGSARFVKFTGNNNEHRKKILCMRESGMCEGVFYVHESDLLHYYKEATKSLRTFILDPAIPTENKTEKVYGLSKEIMKEFFENSASNKVLASSCEVMEIMHECLTTNDIGFNALCMLVSKDYYTYTHSVNVGLYCMTYGVKTDMPKEISKAIGFGGVLHDIGKTMIHRSIINKKGRLTDSEFTEVKKHPEYGHKIIAQMGYQGHYITDMVVDHHENYKGGGYPAGKSGDAISFHGRICKIMDVFDALTTRRSYKSAMKPLDALTIMKKHMNHEFDHKILDQFIRLMGPDIKQSSAKRVCRKL